MRRRELFRYAFAAAGVAFFGRPIASVAQRAKELPRIGYVGSQLPDDYFEAFQQQLHGLGYIDGRNIVLITRNPEGQLDRIPALVRELLSLNVSVLVTVNNVAIKAAVDATATIPLVINSSVDPVAAGYVTSLARPGRNVTGVANLRRDLSTKRVELLLEVFPKLSRLAILWDAAGPGPKVAVESYRKTAQALGVQVHALALSGSAPEIESAFRSARTLRAEAVIVVSNPMTSQHRQAILALCLKYRLPSLVESDRWVQDGGLLSYAVSNREIAERLAAYVDRIVKGVPPGNLPMEQPTTFELAINARTAKALGVRIPPSVLLRAQTVLE